MLYQKMSNFFKVIWLNSNWLKKVENHFLFLIAPAHRPVPRQQKTGNL